MNAISKQASAPRQLEYRINRRLHHRYVMVMRDGFLHVGDERIPCVVRNISSGGLMARVYVPVELGETVKIELATGELIDGTVLWMRTDDRRRLQPCRHDRSGRAVTSTDGDRRRTAPQVECLATQRSRRAGFGEP